MIFLSVKPQVYETVLTELKDCSNDNLFVSVAAGKTIKLIKSFLSTDTPVIRVMPNTPLLIGKGATSMCRSDEVSGGQFEYIKGLFGACGETVSLSEAQFDIATAAGGSMPAFVYSFIEAAVRAAMDAGMEEKDARAIIAATVSGAAAMVQTQQRPISEMIKEVCSPGGTTIAGLEAMEKAGFGEAVKSGVRAAEKRAKELSS